VALPSAPMMVTVGREAIVSKRRSAKFEGAKVSNWDREKSVGRGIAQRWSFCRAPGVVIEKMLTSGVGCWVSIVRLQKVRGPIEILIIWW
jgi:hypothetical protein